MLATATERTRRSTNDSVDSRILHVLQRNGRISNLKLAEEVNRSPSAVLERVKRLQREGYILGYQARLCREMLGMGVLAYVEVRLERMDTELMHRFESAVRACAPIVECHMIAGAFDYLLKVLVTDLRACRDFVERQVGCLPGVREARSHVGAASEASACDERSPADARRLDETDSALLRLLQADGRLTVARLAELLSTTTAAVRERLARLNRQGYILGFEAVLNEAKFNPARLQVFATIRREGCGLEFVHALKGAMAQCPELVEFHELTGQFDVLVKARVPDMASYLRLVETRIWTLPGVREVRSHAAMHQVKSTASLPL